MLYPVSLSYKLPDVEHVRYLRTKISVLGQAFQSCCSVNNLETRASEMQPIVYDQKYPGVLFPQ